MSTQHHASLVSPVKPLGWLGIVRLGMVQSALGAVVALCTSTLNRIMVVEMALPALLPAVLVGLHYAVQLTRPRWGYGSDVGKRRTPWIVGGMGVLCLGALGATDGALLMPHAPVLGIVMSILSYGLIGLGVGAAGTSLLALLATRVAPQRRPAAASITWIMMVFGIVVSSSVVGAMIEPFTAQNLAFAATAVAGGAFFVTLAAVHKTEPDTSTDMVANDGVANDGVAHDGQLAHERRSLGQSDTQSQAQAQGFFQVLREVTAEPLARRFTIFVFLSMMAYSAQDLILEPFAGLVFGMTPGESTKLSGLQNGAVMLGMILTGVLAGRSIRTQGAWLRNWIILGCLGSALALLGLAAAALIGPAWPLRPTIFVLGFANGIFAVSAIGSMMCLAGAGQGGREGTRMGLWGAAQAMAFCFGGILGAVGVDALRAILPSTGEAFLIVFSIEASMFVAAAFIALKLGQTPADARAKAQGQLNSLSISSQGVTQ
jgi:MFS transporter, BCD family, chlorophyll transporter